MGPFRAGGCLRSPTVIVGDHDRTTYHGVVLGFQYRGSGGGKKGSASARFQLGLDALEPEDILACSLFQYGGDEPNFTRDTGDDDLL
jgi:hypothetical protein